MTEAETHNAPETPKTPPEMPGTELLAAAAERARRRARRRRIWGDVLCVLLILAGAAALACAKWFPLFRISGDSMAPALAEGQVVAAAADRKAEPGDMIAFYCGSEILVKRVIARAGDWVDMDEAGTVYVNSFALEEPYAAEKALGHCDVQFPCQVPEGCLFVLGDNRGISLDSRSGKIGFVPEERVIGKLTYRLWPLDESGEIDPR